MKAMRKRRSKAKRTEREVILVVEDQEAVRQSLVALLRAWGYECREAANGEQALSILREGLRPCLILLDLSMPVKSGRDFRAEQLTDDRFAGIPTVVLSSDDERPRLKGIRAFLPKPIDVDELLPIVEEHCKRA